MRTSPPPPCIFSRQGSSQWPQCSVGGLLCSVLPAAVGGCASPVPHKPSWRCPNFRRPDPAGTDTGGPARLHQGLGGVLQEDGWDCQKKLSLAHFYSIQKFMTTLIIGYLFLVIYKVKPKTTFWSHHHFRLWEPVMGICQTINQKRIISIDNEKVVS